ncbi:CxxH/CxxC protein [Pseudalkalibacillus caeni]|uniref:CxxH/CxxC protein n=1 Tax=Exobacillus caeni TaxID=2574798 RepID=A0A5R9F3D2_9BACL|nr:CxxH/CxxC protein [Pseudalkalibacillus caeni]TLS35413.1 CxxH/CxxC protein [Pseudalkalibacillus caeni]
MIYCCEEHIDMALDDSVDNSEQPPIMDKLSAEKQLSTTCEYCPKSAIYIVSN